jgi:hypothetical protein
VATSSTRIPAPTPAASRSESTKRAVIAPLTRPYVLARRDHPAASNALNSSPPLAIAPDHNPTTQRQHRRARAARAGWMLDAAPHPAGNGKVFPADLHRGGSHEIAEP